MVGCLSAGSRVFSSLCNLSIRCSLCSKNKKAGLLGSVMFNVDKRKFLDIMEEAGTQMHLFRHRSKKTRSQSNVSLFGSRFL